jgi:hypothetical protein
MVGHQTVTTPSVTRTYTMISLDEGSRRNQQVPGWVGGSVLHWLFFTGGEDLLTLAGESIECLEEAFPNVRQSSWLCG